MTRVQWKKEQRRRKSYRKYLQRKLRAELFLYGVITLLIMFIAVSCSIAACSDEKEVTQSEPTPSSVYEQEQFGTIPSEVPSTSTPTPTETESEYPRFSKSKDWGSDDTYLLAKIVMAEAEGCSLECKEAIVMVILNRVWSDLAYFPDTIEDVIYQKTNGVYQFTPIGNGRWERSEPNEECYEAVWNIMIAEYDKWQGATYFESCENPDNWHSRNLEFLYEIDGVRFYK